MKFKFHYRLYQKIMYVILVMSLGVNVYYFNQSEILYKIIKTNTDLNTSAKVDDVIRDIEYYDFKLKTTGVGELPPPKSDKILDVIIDKAVKGNKESNESLHDVNGSLLTDDELVKMLEN